MKIQFCGADQTVTGSCHCLSVNGLHLLLDFGLYQGRRDEARQMNQWTPPNLAKADAVILSHGHLDHCGRLPMLARAGFSGPIYCTAATAAVAKVVLTDAAYIQEEDAQYLNRRSLAHDQAPIEPLYRAQDVPQVLKQFRTSSYGQKVDLGHDVSFTFYDAGHILGSAYVIVNWLENGQPRSLLFTADVGRYQTPIIRDPFPLPGPVDVFITESTYGTVQHGPIDQVGPQLLQEIKNAIARGGRVLVPAFAVGRTQTILWYVQKFMHEKLIPPIPVFVDSPMGVEVSHIHEQFPDYFDQQTSQLIGSKDLFGLAHVTFATSTQQSKAINGVSGPCVIIASSPTCEFGRILHHLKASLERPNDTVIFVGFTPPHTLGRRLQDGQNRVRIYDRYYDVKCHLQTIHGLSAHADGDELLRFLGPTLQPQSCGIVVHGEPDRAEGFAQRLVEAGVRQVQVPARESIFLVS